MKRKVIQLAQKTMVVSIPLELVKKFNIKKKDEVDISPEGDKLVIKFANKSGEKAITLNIDNMHKKIVKDLLFFTNTLGYDEITLKYKENQDLSFIEGLANKFEGMALIKQTENSCTFKHISKEDPERFDEMLKRAFDVTESLADGILDLTKKGTYSKLKNLVELENSNNKLTSQCIRILLKGNYSGDSAKIPFIFTLIWNLEIIADFYRRICTDINGKNSKPLDKKTIKAIEVTNEMFKQYALSYKNLDSKGIKRVFDCKYSLSCLVEEIFSKGEKNDIVVGHYLMDIVTYIGDSVSLLLAINEIQSDEVKGN